MALSAIGELLREWRGLRRVSQEELSFETGVSARHISYIETGRSAPSRNMILRLANALEMPLHQRNLALHAGGFAPAYRESPWGSPELAPLRQAVERLLAHHDPFPAIVMTRSWDILEVNPGGTRILGDLIRPEAPRDIKTNAMRVMLHPTGLRSTILNWEQSAGLMLERLRRDAAGELKEGPCQELLAEVLNYPDLPQAVRRWTPGEVDPLAGSVRFRSHGNEATFFTLIAVVGSPLDVTAAEIRIECWHPADEATRDFAEGLA